VPHDRIARYAETLRNGAVRIPRDYGSVNLLAMRMGTNAALSRHGASSCGRMSSTDTPNCYEEHKKLAKAIVLQARPGPLGHIAAGV
jgi:hypothetical protein